MLRGLPASLALHGAVVAAGYIAWPYVSEPIQSEVAVRIELVELGTETSVAPRIERDPEDADPEDDPPPPELENYLDDLEEVPEPPEEVPPEAPEPEPEPQEAAPPEEAAPEEVAPLPDDAPEEPSEPEPEAEPEPEPKPEPVRREPERDPLDDVLGEASNLFDRTPREPRKQPPPRPPEDQELTDEPAPSVGQRGAGDNTGNTQTVVNMIESQMMICWDDVTDLPNPERLNVTIRLTLARDGTLKRDAQLVSPPRAPIGDRPMQVAIERALRAARKCAPYRLPEQALDYYEDWDDVTLNIGPAY